MKNKTIYFLGCIFLFIGLIWLFLPHFAHSHIEKEINNNDESTHFENIIYGLIGTLTGLFLITISNKYEERKIPLKNKTYLKEVIVTLSISGGFIHASLILEHFREWIGYGLFFFVVSIAQIVYGIIILTDLKTNRNPLKNKSSWRIFYLAGITGNLIIIVIYIITRTVGIPFFGPEAGIIEAISPIDIFSKIVEILTVIFLAMLMKESY